MNAKRKVEIFTAGCPVCDKAVELVRRIACPSCKIEVLDMHEPTAAERAKALRVETIPAIAVDGKLVGCCAESGIDEGAGCKRRALDTNRVSRARRLGSRTLSALLSIEKSPNLLLH